MSTLTTGPPSQAHDDLAEAITVDESGQRRTDATVRVLAPPHSSLPAPSTTGLLQLQRVTPSMAIDAAACAAEGRIARADPAGARAASGSATGTSLREIQRAASPFRHMYASVSVM